MSITEPPSQRRRAEPDAVPAGRQRAAGRSAGAGRGARAARRPPRRRDLLIEHLHLIQDQYGHISGRASGGARRRDEAGADRGLRGRDLLRAFRRGEGRRDTAAAGHRARLQFAVLRDGGRRAVCLSDLPKALGRDVRVVRAPCMGACDHAPVCAVGHVQVNKATPKASVQRSRIETHAHALQARRPISSTTGGRRLRAARRMLSPASARATS